MNPSSSNDPPLLTSACVKTLPHRPGIYRFLDQSEVILYVGKARDLKKRVASYFRKTGLSPKNLAMMKQACSIEVVVTHTEGEALLLESNLIKEFRPRYNVLLRDDKSYPYIFLSENEDFPRLALHRGARRAKGRYFGPYPSAGAVRESLSLLQKMFPVRQCQDSFFRNRSRPCLQYQIKRCTAPCVGLVDAEHYRRDVECAVLFLSGKGQQVVEDLAKHMEQASQALDFEQAARYRDQIISLNKIQERQYVSSNQGDFDVIACMNQSGISNIQMFFIRGGRNLGNKSFFPATPVDAQEPEVLSGFISQYYAQREIPSQILVSHTLEDADIITQALRQKAGVKIELSHPTRGDRVRWIKMALHNARLSLESRLASKQGMQQRVEVLQDALKIGQLPTRMECFDISHTMGEATVASCVVFDQNGALKSDYRRFNIRDITPGDDYAAMYQALSRRYTRVKKGEGKIPDILFIDGGPGQLSQAVQVLEELQIDGVILVGVAKGPDRKPGMETLFLSDQTQPIILSNNSPALHLIQQIRDEAHRFAITGHRQRRSKARTTSVLEQIPGMGPKRRQRLLSEFGGLREVASAGIEDLTRVHGISRDLAQRVYDAFHTETQ